MIVSVLDNNSEGNTNAYSPDFQLAKRYGITSFIAIVLIAVHYPSSLSLRNIAYHSRVSETEQRIADHCD